MPFLLATNSSAAKGHSFPEATARDLFIPERQCPLLRFLFVCLEQRVVAVKKCGFESCSF